MNEFKYNPNISKKPLKFFQRDWWLQEDIDATLHPACFPALASEWWCKKNFGDSYNITIEIGYDNKLTWVWDRKSVLRLARVIIKKDQENKKFIDNLINKWQRKVNKFYRLCQQIDKLSFDNLNNQELLKLYRQFYQSYLDEYSLPLLVDTIGTYIEEIFSQDFKKFLASKGKEHLFPEYFTLLTSPIHKSFHNQEKIDLLKIVVLIKKNKKLWKVFQEQSVSIIKEFLKTSPEIKKLLINHISSYFWLQNNYLRTIRLNEDYFIREIKKIIKEGKNPKLLLKQENLHYQKIKQKKEKIIKRLNLPKVFIRVIKVGEKFIHWHDVRKKANLIANHYLDLLLIEIGKRTNLSLKQIKFTLPCEIEDLLLKNKANLQAIKQRIREYIFICLPNSFELVTNRRKIKKIKKAILSLETLDKINEIKGTIVSLGSQKKIQGKVKIVLSSKELYKLQRGDILVAGMTRPDYLVGIKKTAAIITDEGGMTCHAAVVSREFGIPCLIGTKIATKVLKDGDKVEVDADKGMVRKLK